MKVTNINITPFKDAPEAGSVKGLADIELDGLGVRARYAHTDAPFGINLGILFAGLDIGSRYEIFLDLRIGDCRGDAEQRQAENS